MESLSAYATPGRIENLLVKERIKCCKRNRIHDQNHSKPFNYEDHKNDNTDDMSVRIGVNFLMPPRNSWVRQSQKARKGAITSQHQRAKSLSATIRRDRRQRSKLLKTNSSTAVPGRLNYLSRLEAYIEKIRNRLKGNNITLHSPEINYIIKKRGTKNGNEYREYRPIAIYNNIDDKIILAITSKYLAENLDSALHSNILSYRPAREFCGKPNIATDFNSGMEVIEKYRQQMKGAPIYISDCDIKKFYDTIHHDVVIVCFHRILCDAGFSSAGQGQVMKVLDAYLKSYDFYNHVYLKTRKTIPGKRLPAGCVGKVKWFEKEDLKSIKKCYGMYKQFRLAKVKGLIGVPQGGALSLLIANIVLNDVDNRVLNPKDDDLLFCRFCDDMLLMHTDIKKCKKAMEAYKNSLIEHKLFYHDFTEISDLKHGDRTSKDFWKKKSHAPFLWGSGPDGNKWVGFLGYEMNNRGLVRLRLSNVEKVEAHVRRKYHCLDRKIRRGYAPKSSVTKLVKSIKDSFDKTANCLEDYKALNKNNFLRHQCQRIDYCRRLFLVKFSKHSADKALNRGNIDVNQYNEICKALNEQMKGFIPCIPV